MLRDPRPLGPDEPGFANETIGAVLRQQAAYSTGQMAEFDRYPESMRRMMGVCGDPGTAQYLLSCGARSEDDAEVLFAQLISAVQDAGYRRVRLR